MPLPTRAGHHHRADEQAMNTPTAIKRLLESHYWPSELKPGELYQRYEDDSPEGYIAVTFGGDGDAHLMVIGKQDPNEHKLSFRFRMPMKGGGQSPRVRNALLILAEAIRLDNLDRPQSR